MGLDMYIFKTNNHKNSIEKLLHDIDSAVQADVQETICIGGFNLWFREVGDEKNHVDMLDHVAYWRKANHIHEWFSRNVIGNRPNKTEKNAGFITREKLLLLSKTCADVLKRCTTETGEIRIDEPYCRKVFPPNTHITFGGSTEYDEYFIEELRTTLSKINALLLTTNFNQSVLLYFAYH